MTSSGNAGGFGFTDLVPMASPGVIRRVPGWLLDPCGPLFIHPSHLLRLMPWLWAFHRASSMGRVKVGSDALSGLLRASITDTRSLLQRTGLEHLYTELGALTVYKSRQNAEKDRLEWDLKKSMGVTVKTLTSADQIKAMEPALENANYGFYTPEWSNTTDPYELAVGLAEYFSARGGRIERRRIDRLKVSEGRVHGLVLDSGSEVDCDELVISAGIWSKAFCQQLGERVLMESERGYNTTLPNPGVTLTHQIIFGEEKFVITNISGKLRIGGAAEFSGLHRPPNFQRSRRLVEIARRYLPKLDDSGGEQWMGHRPTTPDSLPVICRSTRYNNVYYSFGHGHYGLTMAATSAESIARLATGQTTTLDIEPFHINRFRR